MKPKHTGTLNDTEIIEFCDSGLLISKNYDIECVSQACYELRASNIYYDLENPNKRIDIEVDNYDFILIKPKHSIVLITLECLKIPDYVISRILTKGKLFSIGLLPVNTYADPGFEGNLGIVFYNTSTNYIKINKEERIAKIEFSVLKKRVKNPYTGQHGYQTEIWPIPHLNIVNPNDIIGDRRLGSTAREIERIYGKRYSKVIGRILDVERNLIIAAIFYFTFSLLILGITIYIDKTEIFNPFFTIVLGLITNIVSFYVIYHLDKPK